MRREATGNSKRRKMLDTDFGWAETFGRVLERDARKFLMVAMEM
jgi:hypothetical protein